MLDGGFSDLRFIFIVHVFFNVVYFYVVLIKIN